MMVPLQVLYDGSGNAPAESAKLRAGPLTLLLEQGSLRYIRFGDVEILRRIYVAVRDSNWQTIPYVLSKVKVKIKAQSFHITFTADHNQDGINFTWDGDICGAPDGTITFSITGIARSTFWRNRIGFCVLYPADLAGSEAEVYHIDESLEKAIFPVDLVSDQPVKPFIDLKRVAHEFQPGHWAEVEFEGDLFEMEDQRNWTDASYKVFGTPLRILFPVEVQEGTKILQSITLRIKESSTCSIHSIQQAVENSPAKIVLVIDRAGPTAVIPAIGLGTASHGQPLTTDEITRLKALNLSHLRVELRLSNPLFVPRLRQASHEADLLGIGLEAALLVSEEADQELEKLREAIDSIRPQVSAWLCYPARESASVNSPLESVVIACRKYLGRSYPSTPFWTGTNSDVFFVNRALPSLDQVEGICFAICPQVHAFDNASLVETLAVQGTAVISTRSSGKNLPVRVSPITLKMRFNPYATTPMTEALSTELPPQVDVRQMSLLGAAWTAGSFKYIAEASAESITFYETTGWQGVMETAQGSPLPNVFRSLPGAVFPLYHVLADIGDFKGGSIIPVESSDPLQGIGFLLRKNGRERMVVTNLTQSRQRIHIRGLQRQVSVRRLDETNILRSMSQPEEFREEAGTRLDFEQGSGALELLPYAIAIIDSRQAAAA